MSWQQASAKYRPQAWDEVIDQPVAVRFLKNSIAQGRIGSCYLFHGPSGVGKTSLARIFAAAINCESVSSKPCGQCSICVNMRAGTSDFIVEQDAGGERGLEMVEGLKERLTAAVSDHKYQVLILDECQMITPAAWNSLLKTLEEPPENVVFILVTTDPLRLPTTIRARTFDVRFHAATEAGIAKAVGRLFSDAGLRNWSGVPELIARQVANGSIRDAEQAADLLVLNADDGVITSELAADILGVASLATANELANAMLDKKPAEWLRSVNKLMAKGLTADALLKCAHRVVRDMSVAVATKGSMESFSGLSIEKLRSHICLTPSELSRLESCVIVAQEKAEHCDSKILIETVYLDFLYGPARSDEVTP